MYFMSEKATGNDWKKSSIVTLRHAAGSSIYTTIKTKKQSVNLHSFGRGNLGKILSLQKNEKNLLRHVIIIA